MPSAGLPVIIRRSDLQSLGMTSHRLYALREAGELEQIAPGIYLRPGGMDDTTATWAAIALRKPDATICLLSALALHELTDEIPRATDIALPRGERTLKTRFAPIRWLRRRRSNPGELLTMANHFPKAKPALRSALEILL